MKATDFLRCVDETRFYAWVGYVYVRQGDDDATLRRVTKVKVRGGKLPGIVVEYE